MNGLPASIAIRHLMDRQVSASPQFRPAGNAPTSASLVLLVLVFSVLLAAGIGFTVSATQDTGGTTSQATNVR